MSDDNDLRNKTIAQGVLQKALDCLFSNLNVLE